MRRFFYDHAVSQTGSVGLLLVRVVMGAAFILHGWPKIQHAMDWMGPDAATPGWLQAMAAGAEFGGGIALIVGFFTRLAAVGIVGVMAGALAMVHLPAGDPFVSTSGRSFELPLVYMATALLLLLAGPGRYSLDALLFGALTPTRRSAVVHREPVHVPQ